MVPRAQGSGFHACAPVNPITRREVKALGARGRVPVLADAGRVIEGSDAIPAYLDDAVHSGPRLVPAGGPARRDVLAIEKRLGRHHRPQRIPWIEGPPPPGLPFLDGAQLPRST